MMVGGGVTVETIVTCGKVWEQQGTGATDHIFGKRDGLILKGLWDLARDQLHFGGCFCG
jgi:hypothetical protein